MAEQSTIMCRQSSENCNQETQIKFRRIVVFPGTRQKKN